MSIDPSPDTSLKPAPAKSRRGYRKAVALVVVSVVVGLLAYDQLPESPVAIERDRQPRFEIDPNRPYEISYFSLGLPSASQSSIVVSHDGRVVVKEPRTVWLQKGSDGYRDDRTASFVITAEALAKILRAVETRGVMRMHRRYELKNTFDGSRESIVIKQSEREKRVFCSNYFPDGFREFAKDLDTITGPYREKAEWQVTKR